MQPTPVALSSFMVYNSTLGPREGEEHKRLLYYYPDTEKSYKKINNVGLCEALVQFSKTFSPDKPCENLQTLYHEHFFYEPEPEYWIVMSIRINSQDNDGVNNEDGNLWDGVYHALLLDIYKRFRLLNGMFAQIAQSHDIETLKAQLNFFLKGQLEQQNLFPCDILTVLGSISYPSLEKSVILSVQSLLGAIQDRFKIIKHGLILSDSSLVLSDLNSDDTQILVKFLREKLKLDLPFSKRSKAITISKQCQPLQLRHGRFFLEIFKTSNSKNEAFINCLQSRSVEKLQVCIYQAFNLTLCVFLEEAQNMGLYQQIDAFAGQRLASLSSRISPNSTTSSISEQHEPHLRHIFYDSLSLATETSCHVVKNGKLTSSIPDEVMHAICNISLNFRRNNFAEEEVITKVQNEYWLAAKRTVTKELYVVVNQKNANLINVYESVKKVSAHFDLHFSD